VSKFILQYMLSLNNIFYVNSLSCYRYVKLLTVYSDM